ncbi:MAG: hypothetical protein D6798_06260 [Deltaproteobacteria bacterium]|nr:MAG: hypothetical protein D6798_06260 [Deltaproteobacteria bacterium]
MTIPLLAAIIASLATPAQANERRFTYTYESLTMPRGVREIEPWTTFILPHHEGEGLTMQQRMELEVGLTDKLLTAFYINWSADPSGSRFDGVSSEWKLNLRSRATQAVGMALYGEVGVGPTETELEAKLLLDEEWGGLVVAYNLVGELEWEREEEIDAAGAVEVEHEREIVVENLLAASYKVDAVHFGAEVIQKNEWKEDETEMKLSAGPALGWVGPGLWATATVPVTFLELVDGEAEVEPAVAVRLIAGLDF